MSDGNEKDRNGDGPQPKQRSGNTLELSKTVDAGKVRQNFSHGRSKEVTVEVKRKRTFEKNEAGKYREVARTGRGGAQAARPGRNRGGRSGKSGAQNGQNPGTLTNDEKAQRRAALTAALKAEEDRKKREAEDKIRAADEARLKAEADARAQAEEDARTAQETAAEAVEKPDTTPVADADTASVAPAETVQEQSAPSPSRPPQRLRSAPKIDARPGPPPDPESEKATARKKPDIKRKARTTGDDARRPSPGPKSGDQRRRGKLTISDALSGDDGQRQRSMAAMKRAQKKAKQQAQKGQQKAKEKIVRDVVIPETITVQELANRMAERASDVIKTLMNMGVMATITQSLDADTAQLVVEEFGHKFKRVAEADVEDQLQVAEDDDEGVLLPRAPVVTVMGHVDHGKTSLLDALRKTDVVSGEAGGITQHIGAYQVTMASGGKITFIDTPGHAAFTEMRARGAKVTDIVVLVVAADDSVMPQTIEAINHARAAAVPVIVAINKCDKPQADPNKVKTELLQHDVVIEEMGGEVQCVEVSAKTGKGLEDLEEMILLQAEVLDLKANPNRAAHGVVVEAKMEKGRGSVATILIQRGTLHVGDIFITGSEWGRVRALVNDHGKRVEKAEPGMPVEVLGLNGTPSAGDDFVVVENEAKAREVSDFRQRKTRETLAAAAKRSSLEQMFTKIAEGEAKELSVVIKADVQGSVEALVTTLAKLGNEDVKVRVLHTGVGGINESDITLARASDAFIIGFNVRANNQAREQARRDSIDIRYYSIIYDVADDVKRALQGLLDPELRERFLGYADIREVFNITRVGKVAGCMITEGVVKRGAGVRLLRDDVVIHTGELSTLRRFKDEVKEVRDGYECGMSFANYQDIQPGDVIECFEIEEVAVELS